MVSPEWTDMQAADHDAIQYLRLNELRDHINEILFPYLTTVTPYFRLVSWLTWIYTRLEHEWSCGQDMTLRSYVARALRYYGIFSVAHVLFTQSTGGELRGPIGVQNIDRGLNNLKGSKINFNRPTFGKPLNPTGIYKTSLVSMNLLKERQQLVSPRSYQSIFVPTRNGNELAEEFESSWSNAVKPDTLTTRMAWNKSDLVKLGRLVHLQGLSSADQESKILMNSASSSMREPELYDDFVDLVFRTTKKCKEFGISINYADVSMAALYRALMKIDSTKLISIDLKNSQATALLAYHELHTHTSYGADAILDGLASLANENIIGVSISKITKEVNGIFEKELAVSHNNRKTLERIFNQIERSFSKTEGNYQLACPQIYGNFGFETVQNRISSSENKYQQIALGLFILLQSAACQECFDSSWLSEILPYHRDAFSAYTLLEEYQSLQTYPPKDWTKSIIELIIQKHNDVALSKGPYAKRFELVGDIMFFRADAGFSIQRGRLYNAVLWLSDVGILKGSRGVFTING